MLISMKPLKLLKFEMILSFKLFFCLNVQTLESLKM